MEEFLKLAREVHNERVSQQLLHERDIAHRIKILNSLHSIWCRINNLNALEYKTFTSYVNEVEPNMEFAIKKAYMEKYYGFEFEFNYETKRWFIKNLNKEI